MADVGAKQDVGGGKKGKKDRRRKKDNDEDDEELDAMLAELALELIDGKKPEPKTSEPIISSAAAPEVTSEVPEVKETTNSTTNVNKKKDNKKNKNKTTATNDSKPETKKSEPKTDTKKPEANGTLAGDIPAAAPAGENDVEEDGTKSTKDKKKDKRKDKKQKEPAKPAAGKGPGKKQIAAMQEILRLQKEQEERLEREEEERIAREEEAERQREEQLRIDTEKREKRKQKEKERKERLKKEGKLLTSKQKADLQRAKLSLQIAQESGLITIGDGTTPGTPGGAEKDKTKRKHQRKPSKKMKKDLHLEVTNETSNTGKDNDEEDKTVEDLVEEEVEEEDEEEVVDDWEDISFDDDKKKKKPTTSSSPTLLSPNDIAPELLPPQPELPPKRPSNCVASKAPEHFRSPIICVLGHVDTGKTKLLDYIRKSHVQDNEAGGITQQIGATFVPPAAIDEQCRNVRTRAQLKMPGLLIIDTPGHESFTNLRTRGSSLCDMAILVIDIMHGIEKQTIESINLLKARKTPFVVALNKIDRLYEWRNNARKDVEDLVSSQIQNTKLEFSKRAKEVIVQLAEQSINAALFYENPDSRGYVSLVPTSAHTGDGMGNLINLIIHLTQTMLSKRIQYIPDQLDATVLEVKAIPGLGTTIDAIIINGKLSEGDKIVLAGHDGPIVTHIRSLLVPQPLKELRVKSPYEELSVIYGSMGVKIAAHDLEKAVAGLQLFVARNDAEIERFKQLCWNEFGSAMKAIKCRDRGVFVQASTLGSLEALLEFLKQSKIPYAGVRIGPVVKRDVMKASIMLENNPDYAVILAFDVKIERDAQELADTLGVKIFSAEIIYHLFDRFTEYRENLRQQRRDQNRSRAVFPCKLRILPNCIFNKRDPIVLGVVVEDGILVPGTPIAIPSKENLDIGRIATIEHDHKHLDNARKGMEVCIKIDHCSSDAPKLYGRHFDFADLLYSHVSRDSIDIMKEHFRDDLEKGDWQLMIELKKLFQII